MEFQDIPSNWQQLAQSNQKKYQQFLSKVTIQKTLKLLPELHDEAFSKINCLSCGNCCKNYSPRFKAPDIRRIAKHLRMKETDFVDKYLKFDEEDDAVVKDTPCPFLGSDNACSIYQVRPSDCARFPYTNEDVLLKRNGLTLKNATVCPAVFFVLEKLTAK
jgi:Fe-S-cluster containining protein